LAWNIGTIGITASPGPRPQHAADVVASEWRNVERWV
jgi:hypothetical protein